MKLRLWWASGAFVLGLDAALMLINCPRFYLLCPCPAIFMLSLLFLPRSHYVAFALGPILFFLSSPSLLLGKPRVAKTHVGMLVGFAALEAVYFVGGSQSGYEAFPGPLWTNLVIVGSFIWLSALFLLLRAARKRQTVAWMFAYHFLFALWLITYAFPWLGEMI